MGQLKKILIISSYKIDGTDATSITLRNLFSNYDVDKIAQIYINYSDLNEKSNEKIFIIPKRNFLNFSLTEKIKNRKNKIKKNNDDIINLVQNKKKYKNKVFTALHVIISSYLSLIPLVYSKRLDDFIIDFNPDLIYTPLGDIPFLKMVLKISKRHNIPIVPHFMDDWLSTKYTKSQLLIVPKIVLAKKINDILKNSKTIFVISEKMAKEYELKFKRKFLPLMNCVEEFGNSNEIISETGTLKFCYAGGLHLNRWESLIFLCNSLTKILINKSFELNIFTKESDWNEYKDKFIKFSFVKYEGFLSHSELLSKLYSQSILIHIESFDDDTSKYTRLSISTKIPEYLSIKKPILAIGPGNIASIEYLKDNNCAFVVNCKDINLLESELEKIKVNEKCYEYSENAYKLFQKNHTKNSQQNLLINNLNN